jgi:glutamate-ammonia-ligase adenylyltransferase
VRQRLERESAAKTSAGAVEIKFGSGRMLDVYFAARYLQLRDNVPDDEGDRSTRATLNRLRAANSLDDEDHASLCDGYTLLRTLDHHLRLLVGRSTLLPVAEDHPVVRDLARRAGYGTVANLRSDLASRMSRIRAAYDRITEG